MLDIAEHIGPGTQLWWSQASAEPTPLVHALLEEAGRLGPIRAFCGLTWNRELAARLPTGLSVLSYGALGELRALSQEGKLDVLPCHYSALPTLFAERALPTDVGLVQVSPPDSQGNCSLGVSADYVADAIKHTGVLIAEINEQMPAMSRAPRLPIRRFAATLWTNRPLLEAPERPPNEPEIEIARHVAGLISDGDTVQLGVGAAPSAVLNALSDHRELGLHSGILTNEVSSLIEGGVFTGARKEIDRGTAVAGTVLGNNALYKRLPELPVELRPTSYTHAPHILAQLRNLVAINSAIEVDLSGQVGAELRRDQYVGAIGGQADFSRAAAVTGACSIIALRATAGVDSTIVPHLRGGLVTTARSDVDAVVTEHGVAWLRGQLPNERARRLIAIAAPEHREALERSTYRRFPR